jgi:hypothetical protein
MYWNLEHDVVEKWVVDSFLLQVSESWEEIFLFYFIYLSQPHFLEVLRLNEYERHAK